MVLGSAWLDLSSTHSTYELEIKYSSFVDISQVHQLTLDDECLRF